MTDERLVIGADGRTRCWWSVSSPEYAAYHDGEWGFAVTDDRHLFEKLCLEGFQAGLSWLTVLRKRDRFRETFAGFDPLLLGTFGQADVTRLLADPGIIRHEGKIRSAIDNARRAVTLADEFGSLSAFFWRYAEPEREPPPHIPPFDETATRLARDLKRRGWTYVGPTTVYAFMQAMGLVNDHIAGCSVREACARSRREALDARTGIGEGAAGS